MPSFVTCGDTIKLKVTFRDWDDALADPATITFTAYDEATGQLKTHILEASNQVSTGVYEYKYRVPSTPGEYLVEFNGTLGGDSAVRRLRLEARQVV